MSNQYLFTESIESATITLTNAGSDSDGDLLKRRRLDVRGIDAPSATSTVQITVDYATSTTVDYLIMGAANSTNDIAMTMDYWDGGAWQAMTGKSLPTKTYTGANEYSSFNSQAATKFRINCARGSATILTIGCIFMGAAYSFPVQYDFGSGRSTFYRNETQSDFKGYPSGFSISSTKKFRHNIAYGFTKTQLAAFETELGNVEYNLKPFFYQDTNLDTTNRLVRLANTDLVAEQPSFDFYRVALELVEL